jgi:hypothetical protein
MKNWLHLFLALPSGIFATEFSEPGWYLNGGSGFSTSTYSTSNVTNGAALGLHVQTSLGYSAGKYALEIGSIVSINRYTDVPIEGFGRRIDGVNFYAWQTSIHWAIRADLPGITPTENWRPYVKMSQGIGDLVGFFTDVPANQPRLKSIRTQLEGPVLGFTLGNVFTLKGGQPLFLELTVQTIFLTRRFIIQPSNELPIELSTEATSNGDSVTQLHLSVGTRFL